MSDLIRIVELEIHARIGVPDSERRKPQRLLVTLDLHVTSLAEAAATDNLAHTVDYADVAARVTQLADARPRKLLETLASDIALDVLTHYSVERVAVTIRKFVLAHAQGVEVRIERVLARPD
jgi:dihydroneopterin aldolase